MEGFKTDSTSAKTNNNNAQQTSSDLDAVASIATAFAPITVAATNAVTTGITASASVKVALAGVEAEQKKLDAAKVGLESAQAGVKTAEEGTKQVSIQEDTKRKKIDSDQTVEVKKIEFQKQELDVYAEIARSDAKNRAGMAAAYIADKKTETEISLALLKSDPLNYLRMLELKKLSEPSDAGKMAVFGIYPAPANRQLEASSSESKSNSKVLQLNN
jgi:hypothetical protein